MVIGAIECGSCDGFSSRKKAGNLESMAGGVDRLLHH